MLTQTDARIFLRKERGMFQSTGYKNLRTFNFRESKQEGRDAPDTLHAFNDNTLAADTTHSIEVEEVCEIILLPVAGAIELVTDDAQYVDSGQAVRFRAMPGKRYYVTNPYPRASVNYLEMRFSTDAFVDKTEIGSFDILRRNALSTVFSGNNYRLAIGIFGGREEGNFLPVNAFNTVFTFVIEGAFEVQDRLLERRDGLVLKNAENIDFEALSNEAVLVVLEVWG